MIGYDLVKYSAQSIRKRLLRSSLMIVSIMTGIAAIFVLVSFGLGLSGYVDQIAQEMGTDKLIVQPRGFGFGAPSVDGNIVLDDDDLETIRDVRGVKEATGIYLAGGEVEVDGRKKVVYVHGDDLKDYGQLISEVYTLELAEGRMLRGDELHEALLGHSYTVGNKIFPQALRLRDSFFLNGVKMKVAGFYEEVGNPMDDAQVYLTLDAMKEIFNPASYSFIVIRAEPAVNPLQLVYLVEHDLRKHRGQEAGTQDFQVQTFEQLIETFSTVLGVINAVLIVIALISIVVAGVNITNTMYTAVLERTKEIGIMKAVGARNREILGVFLVEAGILGLIGGVLGVGLGYLIAKQAGELASGAGYAALAPAFAPWLVVGCLLFAFLIGIVSGVMPAVRASKLDPVDALRYE